MITSTQNKWVKLAKQLQHSAKRRKLKQYLLEGEHLVEEAILAKADLVKVFYTSNSSAIIERLDIVEAEEVSSEVLTLMTTTASPQGILAIANEVENDSEIITGPILGIDSIQDPGNLGTMIRTADAAGYKTVLLNKGTVDLYNPKVLRSMQGSQYHLQIKLVDLEEIIPKLTQKGYEVYATALDATAKNYLDVKPTNKHLVIMGNEGNGVKKEILAKAQNVYIPMFGKAESLNVAVATGIILFTFNRK